MTCPKGPPRKIPEVLNMSDEGVRFCVDRSEAVYVGRPSKWGNPFVIGRDGDRDRVIQLYRRHIEESPELQEALVRELRYKDLACWCAPKPCHADVLLEMANG